MLCTTEMVILVPIKKRNKTLILDLATVITNLLSAIPIFGQDLVESQFNIQWINGFFKKMLKQLSAFDTNYYYTVDHFNILPTIGKISPHALKKGKKNKNK
jgi:hypothetical protein